MELLLRLKGHNGRNLRAPPKQTERRASAGNLQPNLHKLDLTTIIATSMAKERCLRKTNKEKEKS